MNTRGNDLTLLAAPQHLVPSNQLQRPRGGGRLLLISSPHSDRPCVFCPAQLESAESWANLIGFGSTNKTAFGSIWAKLMSPHLQTMFVLMLTSKIMQLGAHREMTRPLSARKSQFDRFSAKKSSSSILDSIEREYNTCRHVLSVRLLSQARPGSGLRLSLTRLSPTRMDSVWIVGFSSRASCVISRVWWEQWGCWPGAWSQVWIEKSRPAAGATLPAQSMLVFLPQSQRSRREFEKYFHCRKKAKWTIEILWVRQREGGYELGRQECILFHQSLRVLCLAFHFWRLLASSLKCPEEPIKRPEVGSSYDPKRKNVFRGNYKPAGKPHFTLYKAA